MNALAIKPSAADEFAEVVAWYESQQPGLGFRFESLAKACIDRACERPIAFPLFHAALRRVIVGPFKFAVVYAVEPGRIVVVAIVDLRANPRTIAFRLREEP